MRLCKRAPPYQGSGWGGIEGGQSRESSAATFAECFPGSSCYPAFQQKMPAVQEPQECPAWRVIDTNWRVFLTEAGLSSQFFKQSDDKRRNPWGKSIKSSAGIYKKLSPHSSFPPQLEEELSKVFHGAWPCGAS